MKINVKSLQGDEYIVDVQNTPLVVDLKALISEKANGLPIERQKLVYKGRTMHDKSLLSDYNLEEGCKVHLILQKDNSTNLNASSSNHSNSTLSSNPNTTTNNSNWSNDNIRTQNDLKSTSSTHRTDNLNTKPKSRFEIILRERLAQHFSPDNVDKIMANLEHEINADINSSSLDDLERLAKQKLNISNE